uniref:Uncharacterized protein n=1 Tax=Tanacetum cinerariifolium TaxID=118510 RepID=A0A6L2KDK1_TANCI|nr:hypothetical protein [Tanacetum cinerariifolium]
METKDTLSSCSNLEEQQMQQIQDKAKKSCMYFLEYTQLEIPEFHDTLIQHLESIKKSIDKRVLHKREYESRVNERQMQTTEEKVDSSTALDASLVDTESSGTESKEQDTSSRSENDAHADDADIRPIYNEELMVEERESHSAKPHHVIASSNSRNSSKNMPTFCSYDMAHNHYLAEAKNKTQDVGRNSKPSVMPFARSQSIANGSKQKPKINNQKLGNWPPSMSSRVSNRTVNIVEPSRNQKTFLKSKDLACPTRKKCIYSANHDKCILKYLSKVHSRASAQKKDAQSHKTTKRYMTVEKKCDSKKHDRQILIGQNFSPNKSSPVYLKTTSPRSGLTWKPTGRIFTQVGLKWIPIKKSVETCYNTNDSTSPLEKKTHNPNTTICSNSSSWSAGRFGIENKQVWTAYMAMRVPPAMSPGLSASITEVAAMSDLVFCKRFRSFYESSPSLSLPDLPLRKRYQGTSELVEDEEEEEDEKEGDDNGKTRR